MTSNQYLGKVSAGNTIRPMARPRGELDRQQQIALERVTARRLEAEANYRNLVVQLLHVGCSFSEVSKATGLSTNTLQRWKKESR